MFNLSTQEVVLSIENTPLVNLDGKYFQEYQNFFGKNFHFPDITKSKFKKLENQGIRTTMNYNMNSHLEDMRNEYIKLKKQREIDNSIKFQRKMLMAFVTGVEFLNLGSTKSFLSIK